MRATNIELERFFHMKLSLLLRSPEKGEEKRDNSKGEGKDKRQGAREHGTREKVPETRDKRKGIREKGQKTRDIG
jgi:hypothetical protein